MDFADYIVYVDESGDHSLTSIDTHYPIFTLVFCVFKKPDYLKAVQAIQQFKFKHFGHDIVILHESDIRRDRGAFQPLKTKTLKTRFIEELGNIIEATNFTIIATIIDKNKLAITNPQAKNPYHIALGFCMEQCFQFLKRHQQHHKVTHLVCEHRGNKEDGELIRAFKQIKEGDNRLKANMPFDIVIAHKQCNSTGLQLADLIARPIGLSVIKPQQTNRAFEIITSKLQDSRGEYKGAGVTVFLPSEKRLTPENKKP